jgi:TIR domain
MDNTRMIFISHSSKDAGLAAEICQDLEDRGVNCWIASRDIKLGSHYAEAIIEAIRGARVLLVILSKAANESKHVANEVERAFHEKLVILPFRIEDFRFSPTLEFFLSTAQALDATAGKPEDHLERLYRACVVLTDPGRAGEFSPMVTTRGKNRKWLVGLLTAGGLVVVFCLYFAGGHKTTGPDSAVAPAKHVVAHVATIDTSRIDTSPVHRRISHSRTSEAPSPAATKALEGAVFIDGPTPADVNSDKQLSFFGAEGSEIGFLWKHEIYSIQGKMRLKGNTLEVLSDKVSGSLSLIDQGARIRGSLEVKSAKAPYEIDLMRAP